MYSIYVSERFNTKHIGPVSYTHLDVYKRQMKYRCTFIQQFFFIRTIVYKRSVLDLAKSLDF